MAFKIKNFEIKGLLEISPDIFNDHRGSFFESYKKSAFEEFGIKENFIQDNYSKSIKDCLRGLHYQLKPKAQSKLVRCISGSIFDVAVDLRKESDTYGKWVGIILSEENKKIFYLPEGFAHGFLVLSDYAEVFYKTSEEYSPEHDTTIYWNDPELKIDWNIENPIVSDKDKKAPYLKDAKNNF